MKLLLFAAVIFVSINASAYHTHCVIEKGQAKGFVTTEKWKSATVSGTVTFVIFDEDWDEIDRDSSYEYEYIYNDTEQIDETSVSSDARFCSFDVSGAISED